MSEQARKHQPKPLHKRKRGGKSFNQVSQRGLDNACVILQGYIYKTPIIASTLGNAAKLITLSRGDKMKIGKDVDYNAVLTSALENLVGKGLVIHDQERKQYRRPRADD